MTRPTKRSTAWTCLIVPLTLASILSFTLGRCSVSALAAPPVPTSYLTPSALIELIPTPEPTPELLPEATDALKLHNPTPLSDELYAALVESCENHGVPLYIALGVIEVESSFDTEAVSTAGCYGLMQLNPIYFSSGLAPADNIRAGVEYLGGLLNRYEDADAALTAYNAGHDTGERWYAQVVMEAAKMWEESIYAT